MNETRMESLHWEIGIYVNTFSSGCIILRLVDWL